MANRLDLQELLLDLGVDNVYFQPPPAFKMLYPCIVYNRSNIYPRFADNSVYSTENRYSITVIDSNPDSDIPNKVAALPRCKFDRNFASDGLNHDVFSIIF